MSNCVLFSYHAAQRMSQRLKINVSTESKVNISSAFAKSKTYTHTNGRLVTSWYCTIPGQRIVLIIDNESHMVMTAMSEGPVVDAVYQTLAH